jgi:hypothetical protein
MTRNHLGLEISKNCTSKSAHQSVGFTAETNTGRGVLDSISEELSKSQVLRKHRKVLEKAFCGFCNFGSKKKGVPVSSRNLFGDEWFQE